MGKYKKSSKNSKLKISAPTWNEEFELPDGSTKTENRIIFKIKSGY